MARSSLLSTYDKWSLATYPFFYSSKVEVTGLPEYPKTTDLPLVNGRLVWNAVLAEKHYLSLKTIHLSLKTNELSLKTIELSLKTNSAFLQERLSIDLAYTSDWSRSLCKGRRFQLARADNENHRCCLTLMLLAGNFANTNRCKNLKNG